MVPPSNSSLSARKSIYSSCGVPVQSCVKENERMAAEGRYRRDLPPIIIRFSGMYGEEERYTEPLPQVRFGVRTRPAAPLGRRKVSAAGGLGTRGRGFPSPDSVLRPGGSRGVRVPPAVSVLSVGLNRYDLSNLCPACVVMPSGMAGRRVK